MNSIQDAKRNIMDGKTPFQPEYLPEAVYDFPTLDFIDEHAATSLQMPTPPVSIFTSPLASLF